MSIKTSNLTKIYGTQKALDNVSFHVNSGEIVGLVGPNGAGKSTIMKIICCFIPQSSGDASVCGYDVMEQSLEVRKKVGYLPENNPLYLDMYVREYLSFVADLYKLGKKSKSRVDEMISIVGLEPEQKKKIGALSKGYRQRVGLAQALIHEPEVLVLDEPTSGLDPNQIVEIRNLISRLGKEKTVLFSTHIMQEVEAICDRVIIINKGKIITDELSEDLYKNTSASQIIIVEFDAAITEAALKAVSGIAKVKRMEGNIYEVEAKSDKDIRADIFQFAVNNNLKVLSMQKSGQSLEEIFQTLTKK